MADFLYAQKFVEQWEGFHSNDPDDPGGETLYGITRRDFPNWEGWKLWDRDKKASPELKSLSREFYRQRFWHALQLHQFPAKRLAAIVYQAAISCGERRVARWLQAALNNVIGTELRVDGRVGNHTLHAIQTAMDKGYMGLIEDNVLSRQRRHYIDLVDRKPELNKFFDGWMNRVNSAEKL